MIRKRKRKPAYTPGAPPGLPGDAGPENGDRRNWGENFRADIRIYDGETSEETKAAEAGSGLMGLPRPEETGGKVLWLDVAGRPDPEFLQDLGDQFGLHPLLLEDLYKGGQRPKMEEGDSYLAVHLPRLNPAPEELAASGPRQAAVILTSRGVLSFREEGDPLWKPVAERIRHRRGIIRERGKDYLFYSLVDCLVDYAFPLLSEMEDRTDRLEDRLMAAPDDPELLRGIHDMRTAMLPFRRVWQPMPELLGSLRRTQLPLLGEGPRLYLGDAEDHVRRIQESLAALRERMSGMMEYHLAMVSLGMNGVMKVLTIISTLFIPLTFVAGIYGMNFEHMPELSKPWAYPAVLGGMVLIAAGMLVFFRRKRWI